MGSAASVEPMPTKREKIVGKKQPTKRATRDKVVGKKRDKVVGKRPPTKRATRDKVVGKKRAGWIEFPKRNGKRYATRRRWLMIDGQWEKSKAKRVKEIPPLSETEYEQYKARQKAAKEARKHEYKN